LIEMLQDAAKTFKEQDITSAQQAIVLTSSEWVGDGTIIRFGHEILSDLLQDD